jgi:hypothetical protein
MPVNGLHEIIQVALFITSIALVPTYNVCGMRAKTPKSLKYGLIDIDAASGI